MQCASKDANHNPPEQTRRAWRHWPASKNNWNNFPTPCMHSLSASQSRVWLWQTSVVYVHVVCQNVTRPGMSLIFFRGIRWAGRQTHNWHVVRVLHSFFCWAATGSRQTRTDLLFVKPAVKTAAALVKLGSRRSHASLAHSSLAHSSVRLCVGYAYNEGNVNWTWNLISKSRPVLNSLFLSFSG